MTTEAVIVSNQAGNGSDWLKQGFQFFRASPFSWIGAILIYMLITLCVNFVPILGALISPIVSAFLMGGIILGCQAQSQGSPFKVDYLFSAFSKQHLALARLALIYLGLALLAALPFIVFSFRVDVENMSASQIPEFALSVLLSLALAVPVAMGYWLAPALVVCRGMNALPAFVMSFRGCLKNILPALIFGLLVLFWGILASIPLALGWLVLLPVLIAANFAAYQNIFKTENNLV